MSRYLPTSEFAEDQPLPKFILTSHVLHRGFQAGAILGLVYGTARPSIARLFGKSTSTSTPKLLPSSTALLNSTARGAIGGTFLLSLALVSRMWGREDIEWADRSWRLQHNEGQLETDDWSVGGTVAGAAVAATRVGFRALPLLGGAGLGNVAGVVGYMGWRYGMHGGKRQ